MPSNTIQYPAPYNCEFNNSYTRSACPVPASSCIPMDLTCGWMADPTDSFNCNLCGSDTKYTVPYQRGDQLHFQTQLTDTLNPNPQAPIYGWSGDTPVYAFNVFLLDCNGTVIANDVDAFCSDYIIGYGNGTSYQGLVINTQELFDRFGLTCFSLEVCSMIDVGAGPVFNARVWSEEYCEVNCNDELPEICGDWDTFDCCGNYYGLPDNINGFVGTSRYRFSNCRRYYGKVLQRGATVTKEVFEDNVTRSTILNEYEFQLTRAIPPYYFRYFTNVLYGARSFTIDGTEYIASGNIQNRVDRSGTMFVFDAGIQLKCEKDFNCN